MFNIEDKVNSFLDNILIYGFNHYKDFLIGLFVGLIFAFLYNKFTGLKQLKNSYERIIKEKEDNNQTLKLLVNERLSKIKVEDESKKWFSKLKKYFS